MAAAPGLNSASKADERAARISAWVERSCGGRIVRIERQARWRPIYFIDVEREGETLSLVARCARADMPMLFPLHHEMTIQHQLHEHGIPVPRVIGWCEDPECYVMERVSGVGDLAGLDAAARGNVLREYIRMLAKMHGLPTAAFKQGGVVHADRPEEAHLVGQRGFEKLYRDNKKRPDPFVEFCLGWLRRHPLVRSTRESVVAWDSGQFHQEDGQLVALMDVELGHIGDPMMDLAGLRMRETILGFGDLAELYAFYTEVSGHEVDLEAVRFHHIFFALSNPLSNNPAMAEPPVGSDYMVNLQWTNETTRFALEAIAEAERVELPEIALPEVEDVPTAVPFAHLARLLGRVHVEDSLLQLELRGAFRLARHLARCDQIGRAIVAANLDDIEALTGTRPASWHEGDAALEAFVVADEGRHDRELIALFNRRLQRAQALNGPEGSAIARHHRIQPIGI
jgi:aminoglycoside phosphotransferase (APT) family kinase protein